MNLVDVDDSLLESLIRAADTVRERTSKLDTPPWTGLSIHNTRPLEHLPLYVQRGGEPHGRPHEDNDKTMPKADTEQGSPYPLIKPFHHHIGVLTDEVVAMAAGVPPAAVMQYRQALGVQEGSQTQLPKTSPTSDDDVLPPEPGEAEETSPPDPQLPALVFG